MNKRIIVSLLDIALIVLMVATIGWLRGGRSASSVATSTHHRHSAVVQSTKPTTAGHLTDADVVGVWRNHRQPKLHQKITFTADHKWRENQHRVTNIYSGTWKRRGHNEILLAPYGERIRLSGKDFQKMDVLNYQHILTKETN